MANIKELKYNSVTCYIVKVSSQLLDYASTTQGEAYYLC